MGKILRIRRMFNIWMLNKFFCGTHFFDIKRKLLNAADIHCGEGTCIVGPVYLGNVAKVSFGCHVWVGTKFSVYGNGAVTIEDNVDIAPDVAFLTGSHEVSDNPQRRAGKGVSYEIEVQEGCWIGARSTIMGNTTIDTGTIIAAGAVINRSVGPNVIVGGVPGKEIRSLDEQ